MTPEQKLEQVVALLRQRDEIDAQLLELTAGGDEDDEEEEEDEKNAEEAAPLRASKKPTPKTGKGCPECGSPGRHKKDCSKSSRAKGNPCSECKKAGKHAKWCSRYERVERAAGLKKEIDGHYGRANAMSKENFNRVKTAAALEIPSDTIASNIHVPLTEVDKAMIASTYEDYRAS